LKQGEENTTTNKGLLLVSLDNRSRSRIKNQILIKKGKKIAFC